MQLYGDSLLSVEGPIVHSGLQHGGVDEHNRPPSLLAHQKVPHRACACLWMVVRGRVRARDLSCKCDGSGMVCTLQLVEDDWYSVLVYHWLLYYVAWCNTPQVVADWYLLSLSEVMVGMPPSAQCPHRRGKALRARFRSASRALLFAQARSRPPSHGWRRSRARWMRLRW